MRKAKIEIDKDIYYGYLTIGKIMDVKENYSCSYTDFANKAIEGDTQVLSDLIYESLEDKSVYSIFLKMSEAERFAVLKIYANTLLKLTFPIVEEKEDDDDDFEDMPSKSCDDWDIPWMQYIWESVLKRNNFYEITPRMFHEQFEIHKKINNINEKKTEVL